MKKEIVIEDALKVIKNFPDEDDFIQHYYSMRYCPYLGMDDNSIELAAYHRRCKIIVESSLPPTMPLSSTS